ncbi:hypothetical protein GCM10022221_71170 [Actinocorallia aurea]
MKVLSGRYELVEPLGRGAMGVVYRAQDRELGRVVAVKVLPAELLRSEAYRARFRREARAAAGLAHANIAVVYDVGEDTGGEEPVPYLVMELVEGGTLSDLLDEGPVTPKEAREITVAILEALEHSHGRGIVHRDLKPANIMVHRDADRTRVKVMDFGIARLLSDTATKLTATGMLIGTPSYMAPEQAQGKPTDTRSDLYSVGCVLYELLTGRPPFVGDSLPSVLFQHLQKDPDPPSELNPALPAFWDAIIGTALAKAPEHRFTDAAAMRQAVEAGSVPSAEPVPAPAPEEPPAPTPTPQPVTVPPVVPGPPPAPPSPAPPVNPHHVLYAPPPAPPWSGPDPHHPGPRPQQAPRRRTGTGRRGLVVGAVTGVVLATLAVVAAAAGDLIPGMSQGGDRQVATGGGTRFPAADDRTPDEAGAETPVEESASSPSATPTARSVAECLIGRWETVEWPRHLEINDVTTDVTWSGYAYVTFTDDGFQNLESNNSTFWTLDDGSPVEMRRRGTSSAEYRISGDRLSYTPAQDSETRTLLISGQVVQDADLGIGYSDDDVSSCTDTELVLIDSMLNHVTYRRVP